MLPPIAFRVTKADYAKTAAVALSGIGGVKDGGRWHSAGQPILYAAQSSTLCLLERIVHADEWIAERHPDRVMLAITLPRVAYLQYTAAELAARDPRWRDEGNALCRALGDVWLARAPTCALLVPSAANPSDSNILLNPRHDDFAAVIAANDPIAIEPLGDLDERIVALVRARRA